MEKYLYAVLRQKWAWLTIWLIPFLVNAQVCPPIVVTDPYIGGRIFLDYGQDGVFNAGIDQPIVGVSVSVYGVTNTLLGTTTSSSNGVYLFESASMTNGSIYRIEFTDVPAIFNQSFAGTNNKTSVQFALAGSCDIDFGIMDPALYCQADPRLAVNRFVEGSNLSSSSPVISSVLFNAPASANESNDPNLAATEAIASVVGSTFGLAYQRTSKNLFASAYMKRFAGFGPSGPGAIYRIPNPTDGITSGNLFVDLNTLFGSPVAGTDLHNFTTLTSGGDFIDEQAFNLVGRTSLGDMDISDDELTLWVVNMHDRSLYKIPLGTDPENPVPPSTSAEVTVIPLADVGSPLPDLPSGISNSEIHPHGLKFRRGKLYIGLVTNGQSGGPLRGLVYSYDVATATFAKELDFSLAYDRGCGFGLNSTCYGPAQWQSWLNNNVWPTPTVFGAGESGYPQPMLSDIEFDAAENMLLSLRDRWGDQGGRQAPQPNSPYTLRTSDAFGDLLRANATGSGGWTISITDFTDPSTASSTSEPVFGQDNYGPVGGYYHEETGMGAMATHVRQNQLLVSVMDARSDAFTNGLVWFNMSVTAAPRVKSITVLSGAVANPWGKASGLGDIEMLCDLPPIEIGNLVWYDANGNGIQDPDEIPLPDVILELYTDPDGDGDPSDGVLVGSTTTNANGNYYFNPSNVILNGAAGLVPKSKYIVQIASSQWSGNLGIGVLFGYELTLSDVGGAGQPDVRDNDAILSGGTPRIGILLGDAGETNHTYDIGLKPACNLEVAADDTPVSCFGGSNGTIEITVTGAQGAVTYLWNDGTTTEDRTGLSAGTYSVTVTENPTCTATDSFEVTQPDPINITTTVTDLTPNECADTKIDVTVIGGTPTYTYLWNDNTTTEDRTGLSAGTYSVTVTDTNNCTASEIFTDAAEPPALTCPASQIIPTGNNGLGDCTGAYTILNPINDNCPATTWSATFTGNPLGNPANLSGITNGNSSGSVAFQKGITSVTLNAADTFGNNAIPCSFTVTVVDDEAPILLAIINQTILTSSNGTGDCTGAYTIPSPMTDNCPNGTWSAIFTGNVNGNPTNITNMPNGLGSSAITFQKGVTNVELIATDEAGNTANHYFSVMVQDDELPILVCPTNQTIVTSNNGTGDCTGVYAIPSPMTDNCPGGTWGAAFSGNANGNPTNLTGIANGNGSGSITFQKGTTVVQLTATDATGSNTATCSFTVTLNDDEVPGLTCPTNQTIVTSNNGTGDCTGIYAIPSPMTDNCPGGTWGAAFSGNPNGNPGNFAGIVNGSGSLPITFQKGTTTVLLTATDATGNTATCSFTVTLNDDEVPGLTCPTNQTIVTSNNGTGDCTGIYAIPSPMTDNCPGGTWSATFSGNPNGNPANLTNLANGAGSGDIIFQKGTTTVTLTATDESGNNAVTCSFTVTLNDDEPPILICPMNTDVVTSNNGMGDCNAAFNIPNPVTDNCPGGMWSATFSGNPNGVPPAQNNIPFGSNLNYALLQKGATTVTLLATDASGNTATCSFMATVIDDEPPMLYCSINQIATTTGNGAGDCTGKHTIVNPLADNCPGATWGAVFSGNANGLPANFAGIPEGNNSAELTIYQGITNVTLIGIDAQGNMAATCDFTITLLDNEIPTMTCPANQTIPTSSNGTGDCTGSYNIPNPVSDNCLGATWSVQFSGNPNGYPANISSIAAGNNSGSLTFQHGVTTVTLLGTDSGGNTATCSFTVTVADDENPVLTCPANQNLMPVNTGQNCTANYNIPNPLFDNCNGALWNITYSGNPNGFPPPMSNFNAGDNSGIIIFQQGTTTVTLNAADATGNNAVSCSFTVTIDDTVPPNAVCPANITHITSGAGICQEAVNFILPPATDNCTATPLVTSVPASGSVFGIGATTVTVTATDLAGNTATCSFMMSVKDPHPPTAICPANMTPNPDAGICGAIVNFAPTASDDCTLNPTINATPASGSMFSIGSTTVVVTATDESGNTGTCAFMVTVNNPIVPVISGNTDDCGSVTLTAAGGVSYLWSGGINPTGATNTFLTSGNYFVTITNANGCTAVTNTTVTVTPDTGNTANITACGSYMWAANGQTYTTSGIYTYMVGCYTETLNLTIQTGAPTYATSNMVACNSYTWAINGQTYTTSGNYAHTVGCHTDSLKLTIHEGSSVVGNIEGTVTCMCVGLTISTEATGGNTYYWSCPDGYTTTDAHLVRPNATSDMTGIYTVTIDAENCISSILDVEIIIHPTPPDIILGDVVVCEGSAINLTAFGGASYEWFGPDGFNAVLSDATLVRTNATPAMGGTYTVVITSEYTCQATASVAVTVLPRPIPIISGNTNVCLSGVISLTASGGDSYAWSGPGGYTATGATFTRTATIGTGGVYSVTVTGSNGCTAVEAVLVNISSGITPNVTGSTIYCEGNTITLTASGGSVYEWSGPNGYTATGAVLSIPNATTFESGNYVVTVSNASGCTASVLRKVTVNASPWAAISGNLVYCVGSTLVLSASGGGSYLWSGPGFTATTANISRTNLTTAMAGAYTVTITNSGGCNSVQTVWVTVNEKPIPDITGATSVCTNGTIILTASGGDAYQWAGPGGFTASGATMTRPAISGSAGIYTVTVTNSNGCTASKAVSVSLLSSSISISVSGVLTYCAGTTINLTAGASGATGYQWSGPGGYTSSGALLSIPAATPSMSGVYTVTVTNAGGCTATASRTVTINPLPLPAIVGNTVCCVGNTISLTASGGVSYQWSGPGFSSTSATINRTNASVAMAGTYTVTVTGTGGCKQTANIAVVVNPQPVVTITGATAVCLGGIINLTATGGDTYQWAGPGGFTASGATMTRTAAAGANGTYIVTVTNSNGCTATKSVAVSLVTTSFTISIAGTTTYCATATISLTAGASGGVNYQWSGPGGFSFNGAAITIPMATTANTGTYVVTVTNAGGCTATAQRIVTVNALPTAAIAGNTVYCAGSTISLIATGGISYQWSGPGFSASTATINRTNSTIAMAGIYTVTVTGTGGCKATASTMVLVNPKPTPALTGPTTVCSGNTFAITASGGVSYQWSGPGGFVASGATMTRTGATSAMAGNYYVTVTNDWGCTATAIRNISVLASPIASITGAGDVCTGASFSLFASGGGTYTWSGPGGYTASGSIITRNSATPDMSGAYIVTVTATNACTASASRTITVASCKTKEPDADDTTSPMLWVYPNPSDGYSQLGFTLSAAEWVKLVIFAEDGKEIANVFEGYAEPAIQHNFPIDLSHLSAGVYFAALYRANGISEQIRVMVVK